MNKVEIYYSPGTKGFYRTDFHADKDIPGDRIHVTVEEWTALLDAQSSGREIVLGTNRRPIAVERKKTAADMRLQRDDLLNKSDWLVSRHRDEIDCENSFNKPTLTNEQFLALQEWRQQLRWITDNPDFPNVDLPKCPV